MPRSQDDASQFLAEAKASNPLRYAEIERQYPINSPDDNFRHAHGVPRRRARHSDTEGTSSHVTPAQRRRFSDVEWAEAQEAIRRGRRECDENEKYARRLADESM